MKTLPSLSAYLASKKRTLLTAAGITLMVAILFFLYDLPWEPFRYGLILYLLAGIWVLIMGYSRFRGRLVALEQLSERLNNHQTITQADAQILPYSRDAIDDASARLMAALVADAQARSDLSRARLKDLSDAITLWTHQIKTPIAAADMLLQNLGDAPAGTPLEATRSELSEQLFRITGYVDMALQVVRVESGSDLSLTRQPIDPILCRSIRSTAKSFIRRNIRMDYTPCLGQAVTDSKWLSFVVEQILSNALKYTASGGGVRIFPEKSAADGTLTIVIADTGIGIAPADLPRIFDKGFTGFNGRSKNKATGLGLYLCKTTCDRLGHTLAVTSTPGKGTQVRLTLALNTPCYE